VNGDEALARRVLEIGVPAFLREWMAQPLFGIASPDPADVVERETNVAAGLASSLRLAGTGSQVALWDRLRQLTMPVLVMAGERDTKYVDIGREIAAQVRDGSFATISEADHAAHLRRPDQVVALLRPWLQIKRP
jgi:2-succinyl-6-hydroxy-2,4-cyclohexadiene-1-carboxylate synthase